MYSETVAQPMLIAPEPVARLRRWQLPASCAVTSAIASTDDEIRWAAATTLTNGGGWRLRATLERIAKRHPSHGTRATAAWTLGFRGDTRAATTLAHLLRNTKEHPNVRAHAAEALGHLLSFARPLAVVENAVIAGLDDPSADVRFWSAFAAATIPVSTAAPRLRVLASDDQAEVAGLWPVATEAEWALRVLDGDPNADDVLPRRQVVGEH